MIFTIASATRFFPRLKYLANSHSDTSDTNVSIEYIRTDCPYLMYDPFRARRNKANAIAGNFNLSSRQNNTKGNTASAAKPTGNKRSQRRLSPPIAIQI